MCVPPLIESGIIQDAQQEAFIWLSLCCAASANINPEINSCSLFCHSSVGGRVLHLYRASFQRRETLCLAQHLRAGGLWFFNDPGWLLSLIPSPPTGDPGPGLRANPESASLLRLPLLRKSGSPFPSLWIQNPGTRGKSQRQRPKTFDPDPLCHLAAPRGRVH